MDFTYKSLPEYVRATTDDLIEVAKAAAKLVGDDPAELESIWQVRLVFVYRMGWHDGRIKMNQEELVRITMAVSR